MRADTEPRPSQPAAVRATPVVPRPHRSHRWRWVALAVAVPVLLVFSGLWYSVLRHEAPPIATLDRAVAGIQAPTAADAGAPVVPATVDGTWTIDPTITNSQGIGSYTGFRVDEVLAGVGATTAVGRTPTVEGSLTVDDGSLIAATVSADLRRITSDESRRDSAIQRALDTSRYPTAPVVASVEDHATVELQLYFTRI